MLLRIGQIHVALTYFELNLTSDHAAIYHPRSWGSRRVDYPHIFILSLRCGPSWGSA